MRILYIHQYFKTPQQGGPIRSYYIASALAEAGHEVVMLTTHNKKTYEAKQVDGISVHYLPVFYENSLNPLARSRAFLQFAWQACRLLLRLPPFDLCYASSTPLTAGLPALFARRWLKLPFLFEVRDLWPEAPIQFGYIKNPLAKKALRQLEQALYRQARAVIALSPGIARGIAQSSPSSPLHLIPNMADCRFFSLSAEEKPTEIPGIDLSVLDNKFVVSYLGAAGAANRLEYLLMAARACQEQQLGVQFLLAAEGGRLASLKNQASLSGLRNVAFVPYGNKEQLRDYLSLSDAVYTCFGPQPVLETNSPNKFFDGLAAGKLSIVNTRGWLKELVEAGPCGFYTQPENPLDFVLQLRPFLESRALLTTYQQNARRLAEQQFSREALCRQAVQLVEQQGKRA